MDLIKCPVCGEEYSPSYRRCPFCEEMKSGRKRRGGHRVSDKKHSYSARGPLIAVLVLVLALLSWYLFGTQVKELFVTEESEQPPVVEEPTPSLPDNEELFFDPTIGDEPDVGGEETPNEGDAPVVEQSPVVENPVVDNPSVDLSALALNRTDFTLSIGESFRLKAEPEVEGIIWSAEDGSVVSVTEEGLVTGLSKGKTTVTARLGEKELECIVFVRAATAASEDVSNAALSKADFTLSKGERYTVKVTGTTATPKWSIDDTSIATISDDGTVKAVGKGHTNFYAKVGGKTLKGVVFVK